MTFKIKDSLSIDGNVVIDQNKNITANDVTVNGVLTANGSAVQPQLVSGSNIKTINGTSVLGSGDIAITSGGASIIGEIRQITSSTIPYGWLLCDGAAISRSTYALLFAAIGTAYGAGDGSTTFNLPDYRGSLGAGTGLRSGQTLISLSLGDSYNIGAGSTSTKFNAVEPTSTVGIVAVNFIIAATGDAVFVDAPAVVSSINGLVTSKQDTLVSGTNIKTVNGASLLGSGNVDVGGSVNGILKSNGSGGYSAAVAGTDYVIPAGNTATSTKLATSRAISASGDATWTVTFDGSADVSAAITLANSGATAGTYRSVTVNAKGIVTGGTNPTTLSGYGITDAAPLAHTTDATLHLTSAQNTWIDAITATSTEVNYLSGVTSAVQTQINGKQASLVSGTNIKTVNGTSVLGSGDLVISAGGFAVSVVSANTNAVKSTKYVVTAAATITLPAAPAAGDQVAVVNRSGGTSVVVASNGLNVLGSVQDITLDVLNISLTFTYSDATTGWIID